MWVSKITILTEKEISVRLSLSESSGCFNMIGKALEKGKVFKKPGRNFLSLLEY